MNVRVVEDNPDIAALLKFTLEQANGFDLQFTTSDFPALLNPEPWEGIDAALVDLMLAGPTGISGVEILRYLHDSHPHVRRVAMTAGLDLASEARSVADDILIKPFHTSDVIRALR